MCERFWTLPAIEDIAKTGNEKAEHHARLALKYLEGKPTTERSPD